MQAMTDDQTRVMNKIFSRCTRTSEGCLEWQGTRNAAGYGRIRLSRPRRNEYTHRVIAKAIGYSIDGLFVCHHCDNPPCCEPSHLFVGSQKDNILDAITKGRTVDPPITDWVPIVQSGCHHWQKLTAEEVFEIRALLKRGFRLAQIADRFGVSFQQISKIKHRIRWGHL